MSHGNEKEITGRTMHIRIIARSDGVPTEFDGQYVKEYDPNVWIGDNYDGGLLEVTPNVDEARTFTTAEEAIAYYRQAHGIRPDGRPNRPLTAFTVEFS